MTVSTTTNKVVYIGNGIATTFAIPFPFLEREHLKVRQLLNNVQTERSDWTVSGGNLVFATAPANDAQIVIMREVPLTQETDYRENEILPAETLERNFDKLTMQVQQLKEQADRAVTVDVFDDTEAASLIPSIRQTSSDTAIYAQTAIQSAATAAEKTQLAANSVDEAAALLANKADKNVYASTTTRGLAQWANSTTNLNENTPSVIIFVIKSGNCVIRLWSDGMKEIFDFLSIESTGVMSYTFPRTFTYNPFVFLSQSMSTSGAIASVVSLTQTGIQFTNRIGNSYFGFSGWIYLYGY